MSERFPGGFIMANPTAPTLYSAPGIWTLDQAQQYIKAGTWPGSPDPYFPYTTLLLPGNGTNGAQNNTFLDSSTNNFTITRNGNTTQGTFAPYGANWSNYFDGTGDYLTTTLSSAVTSTYTIDFWINTNTVAAGDGCILNIHTTAGNTNGLVIKRNGSQIQVNDGATAGTGPSGGTLSAGTWTFVTVVCNGTNTILYINGSSVSTYAGVSLSGSPTFVHIGHFGDLAGGAFAGYISNVRVVVGSANTPSSVVPTSPSTAITNTKLLTCQSNRFIENSANNFTITRNGDVSVQVFSPFNPTASYAAGTIGGSGYFDGNGDYLDVANNNTFDTNSTYTFECWFYQPAAGNAMLFNRGGGTGNWNTTNGYQFTLLIVSGVLYWQWNNAGSPATISVTTPTAGAWHHFAVGYDGTTTRAWVDGASIGTSTTGYTMPTTRTTIRIGADQSSSSSNPLTGYISGFRFVKGTDVYGVGNTTITVPTTPPTAISNTSLLLNFTNAGVIDNAMMNDLETVADAQISATQSKWGGSSIYLDGTGDYLQLQPSSQNFNFGASGDYTIEAWIYQTNRKTDLVPIFQTAGTNATGYVFGIDASTGGLAIYDGGSYRITATASTVSLNTWTHVAATRSGGTTRVFIDGVQAGSATYTYSSTSYADPRIGINASYTPAIFQGYIDDFRITKGYARYTANFTPPAGPFPTR